MLEENIENTENKEVLVEDLSNIDELLVTETKTSTSTAHDDFDWSVGKRNTIAYTKDQKDQQLQNYEKTLNSVAEFEVVKGKVSAIHGGDVILDINYKSDGLVPLSEFRDTPDLKIGDYVDVYVENKEDLRGQLVLSRRKAKLLKGWDTLVDSYKNGTIIKGFVLSKTKGGLIVDCLGLETFLPGSQIDVKPITDYDGYVGKTMEFKVVKINEAIKNAVVSHKALIESDLAEQRETIIAGLEKGQVLEGVVKNITDFGAFMDLGGVDGLLYITDISWGRINHPNEVLELNQKINVCVLEFDEEKKRISLGLKQLTPHPWEILDKSIAEGSVVKGKIVNIEDYGAFLEINPGVEGLIHVSEVTWSNQPVNARDYFTLGQEFEAKVVTLERESRKMSLSVKQLSSDPWSSVAEKYASGTRHSGVVKNLTPYGVFIELEEGIGGMVHISDLSWTKRYNHPSEFTKVGETIDVQVIECDIDNRKLSLGHKQNEENPWETFQNVFPVGSYHQATIIKKDDRGAVISLPYGLEAYSPIKHLRKEDGTTAGNEEILTFKVIEFNADDKKIIVSHSRYVEDIKKEADETVKGEVIKEKEETRKAIAKTNEKVEKATLGDLFAMAAATGSASSSSDSNDAPAEAAAPVATASTTAEVKVDATAEATATESVTAEAESVTAEATSTEVSEEAVEAKAEKKAKTTKAKADGDNLVIIEGIGPKIAEVLNNNGITTFAQLAATNPAQIRTWLDEAGPQFQVHDPGTWPAQAGLAAEGKMDELNAWQAEHKGGKAKADDLVIIEGIGPKIAEILNNNGITTFAQLAATDPAQIRTILDEAGPQFQVHDPASWPLQSSLAAEGKMDELNAWQAEHKGGKL
jgi:small subunit ribosomal protein S1